jgi:hypothetical protein
MFTNVSMVESGTVALLYWGQGDHSEIHIDRSSFTSGFQSALSIEGGSDLIWANNNDDDLMEPQSFKVYVWISDTQFINQQAPSMLGGRGGGIIANVVQQLYLTRVHMINNTALVGAAIFAMNIRVINITNSIFIGNRGRFSY